MHKSSMESMREFFSTLDKDSQLKILDVGSCLATGQTDTYKKLIESKLWEYTGLDLFPGNNVDVVAESPFIWPFENKTFDVVISGQCLEHVSNPFKWIAEISRVLKPEGQVCIIVPSAGPIHRSPPYTYDYWRIHPDGMEAILNSVNFKDVKVTLSDNNPWRDCVGVGKK